MTPNPLYLTDLQGARMTVGAEITPEETLGITLRSKGGASISIWLSAAARQALQGHLDLVEGRRHGESAHPTSMLIEGTPGFVMEPGALAEAAATVARAKVMLEMEAAGLLVLGETGRNLIRFMLGWPIEEKT